MSNSKKQQQRLFNNVDVDLQKSKFDLSHKNKLTANFNRIYPTLVQETLPNEHWTFSTSFFSRWLSLVAPVFAEYNIKFNNFFISNQQLWGGWQQFIADGDDQAQEYLLDGDASQRRAKEVPYFTSSDIAKIPFGRLCSASGVKLFPIQRDDEAAKVLPYRLVLAPMAVREAKEDCSLFSDADVTFLPHYFENPVQRKYIMLWAKDSDFLTDLIEKQVVYLMEPSVDFDTLSVWLTKTDYCCVYAGANVQFDEPYAIAEIPQDWHPFDCEFYGKIVPAEDYSEYNSYYDFDATLFQEAGLFNKSFNRYFGNCQAVKQREDFGSPYFLWSQDKMYFPVGYLFQLIPNETSSAGLGHHTYKITPLDVWNRTIGQDFVQWLLGSGTLSDYLGIPFEDRLLRQPFEVADYILNNVEMIANLTPARWSLERRGTYNQNSPYISIGIVSDEKISILPYLAYKNCWSNLMRDPRYELRDIFCDPYRSPFLVPLADGSYLDGHILQMKYVNGVFMPVRSNLNYNSGRESRDEITLQNPFTFYYLCADFFTFKQRRCVQDRFTLLSPTPQYGEEIMASGSASLDDLRLEYADGHRERTQALYSSGQNSTLPNGTIVDSAGKVFAPNAEGLSSISVSALRLATRLQKFCERNNLVGSDYIKQILAHFGVTPPHCNHCSCKYLGGDKFTPTTSPVDMVAQSTDEQVTGQQSANLYSSGNTGKSEIFVEEHGYIMQLMTIQNDFITTSGLPAQRISKFDFAFPEFANLGSEQVPLSRLVHTDGSENYEGKSTNPRLIFGYQNRYADYKCALDEIHGDFRKTLRYWVTPRQFNSNLLNGSFGLGMVGNVPELGKAFLYENANYQAFAYEQEDFDHAMMDIDHNISVVRCLPVLPSPNVL